MGFGSGPTVAGVGEHEPPQAALGAGPQAVAAEWPLVGRVRELDALERAVGAGRSVVVTGEAGVGKSRLLAGLLVRVSGRGTRTVLVRATRSTATIPFGPFAAWTSDGGHRAATDRLQVLRTTTRALLGDGGVCSIVVAVDDAHVLDESSAALVLHLVEHTPAAVVVSVRTGEPSPDAVVALWKEGLADRLELRPLSEPETATLAEHALGGPLDPAAQRRLWLLSLGTPVYVRELLHAAVARGVLTRLDGTWCWRHDPDGGGRASELRDLRTLLDDRLGDVTAHERRALELLALGEPLPLDLVAALGCMDALTALERRGLVTTDDHDELVDQPMARLAHPLYGEVLRAELPRLTARAHHRALAVGAATTRWYGQDPLRVATWWLEGGGQSAPVEVLVAATRRALALGAWTLADRLGRAAESSGAGPEATLTRAAALVHLRGWGEVEKALAGVRPEKLDQDLLAEHARLRAGFLAWSRGRADAGRAVLVQATKRMPPPSRSAALAEASYIALMAGDLDEAASLAAEAMNDAGRSTNLRVRAMAVAATTCMLRGHTSAALRMGEMASPYVASAVAADPYPDNPIGLLGAAYCLALVLDGRVGEAVAVAESALEPFLRDDVAARRTACASVAGRVALLAGRPSHARQRGRMALAAAGPGPGSQWPAAIVAMAAAQLGDVATAESVLEQAEQVQPRVPLFALDLGLARAWLHAARGDMCMAVELAAEVAAGAAGAGMRAHEVLTLVDLARLGAPKDAGTRLDERRSVVEGAYVATTAAYGRALAKADGDELDALSGRFETMGAVLLAAEAAAAAAAAHRASGRRQTARTSSGRAGLLAARCEGARTPALRQLGVPPRLATLTRREREVAELAASGLSNREISERLHISIRTVHAHLNHTYTKLGMNDRGDLAALLQADEARHRPG